MKSTKVAKQIKKYIVVDGGDGNGKTTVVNSLKELGFTNVCDRGLPTVATIKGTPNHIPDDELYIIIDCDPVVARDRIVKRGKEVDSYWHSSSALSLYRQRYREVAGFIGAHLVNGEQSREKVLEDCVKIITGEDKSKIVPNIDKLTEEEFNKLKLVCEGESKIVREISKELNLVAIKLKPTVYSYTHNRCGTVKDTDKLRAECTNLLLDPIRFSGVDHSFWCVNERFILSSRIFNPPPIEVVVKKYHVGTPKHRYYGMHECKVRTNYPIKDFVIKNEGKYPKSFVRFDWRNPMKHPKTGERLADEVLCDEQADFHIDVKNARKTAMDCFNALQEHFNKCGIELWDICFFVSEDGKTIFSEVSQDCGRYRKIFKEGEEVSSLDKDIWRSGGSSKLVVEKWKQLIDLLRDNKWVEEHTCTYKIPRSDFKYYDN